MSLYRRIFQVESPARRLLQHFLSNYVVYGTTVPGTLLERVVNLGESPVLSAYCRCKNNSQTYKRGTNGHVDSLYNLLHCDNFIKPYSQEHLLVHLLTTSMH